MKEIWKARKDNTRPWINYEFRTCTASLTGWNDIVRLSVLINWNETKNRNLSTRWSQAFGGGRRFRISGWSIDWDDSVFQRICFSRKLGVLSFPVKISDTHGTWHFYLTIKRQLVKAYLYTLEREREREKREGGWGFSCFHWANYTLLQRMERKSGWTMALSYTAQSQYTSTALHRSVALRGNL